MGPSRSSVKYLALVYRRRGLNPLPADVYQKRPILPWGKYRDEMLEDEHVDAWNALNIQIPLGKRWNLLVVDCDGEKAVNEWRIRSERMGGYPVTWEVTTPRGGLHVYFALRESKVVPNKTVIWDGGEKHSAIEVLGDGALITAPPSKRIVKGEERYYKFLPGHGLPNVKQLPVAPDWLWKRLEAKPVYKSKSQGRVIEAPPGGWAALAQSWGLKLAGREGSTGWIPCYRAGKEEQFASASLSAKTGNYVENGSRDWISIWDLGVLLGVGRDWKEVKDKYAKAHFGP